MTNSPDHDAKENLPEDLRPYIGANAFTVLIDDSPELRELTEKARALRELPFIEKLIASMELALGAMSNAYEAMVAAPDEEERERGKGLVLQKHPLSVALKQKSGCCRYQGALFFILSYEAQLGDHHFLHAARVLPGMNTVFNEVVNDGKSLIVSIFKESLEDKSLDYSMQNPAVYRSAFKTLPGYTFYSYHRTPSGFALVANPDRHADA